MELEAIKTTINSLIQDAEFVESGVEFPTFIISNNNIYSTMLALRDGSLKLDFLFCQTAIDYPEHIHVCYHLRSTTLGHTVLIKVKLEDRENAKTDSVNAIWRTAEFHELEMYDLFGIHFEGHPQLRRLLLTDDWEGYPLRKDYEDPINMVLL